MGDRPVRSRSNEFQCAGLHRTGRRTLTIEIGMQKAGMRVVPAPTRFKDQSAVALPLAIFTIRCIITANLLTINQLRRERKVMG